MKQIVPDLFQFEGLRASNVYLLVAPEGLTLVDSGMPGEAKKIMDQVLDAGFELARLKQIVLTHGHGDHMGSAEELARQTQVKVFAHLDEVALIEGTEVAPKSLVRRWLGWLEGLMLKMSPCQVDIKLSDGDAIPNSGGYMAVHTPGHTPGSLSLYHPSRKILICGDALLNRHPILGKRGLQEPPAMLTRDRAQAHASVVKLSQLDVEVLLCGHGEAILEEAGGEIKKLVHKAEG